MVVVNDWGDAAMLWLSDTTVGVAEMAINRTIAATVVQRQAPSGTAKAAAGATSMDDKLRATNHRRYL